MMFTTFDRYLLGRLLHTFAVFFVAAYGLYIVIDLFTNIDNFQRNSASSLDLLFSIIEFYAYRASEFFEMAGPMLVVISVIVVLGLLQKHAETYPILAAGVPAFRLLRPLLVATAILNGALITNQEFVIPAIAVQLQTPRGSQTAQVQKVEPVYDYWNYLMHIDGDQVLVQSQTLVGASFTLPKPEIVSQICMLKAEKATFVSDTKKHGSGWLLQNLTAVLDTDLLTEEGRKRIIPSSNGKDVFIVSEVSFDQLYNRGRNMKLLSSMQLIQRIQNPSTGPMPVRGQSLALHSRITRPFLCLLNIVIALPLVMRKESHSLITNMVICSCVLGGMYAVTQGCFALGSVGLISPDFAAWLPVILAGALSTWTFGLVQT
ncbi:MAG TPA: LptF/LptG family permease [Planctomycetaceae bacterium]|nr:LptF/LptG family permease [Planctomycetaceae bacterium]HQZ64363.1 LptF/LptG family permease [Planctomycetaceae bacterium]